MNGPEDAAEAVRAALAASLAAQVAAIATRRGVTVPGPKAVNTFESGSLALDDFPTVEVFPLSVVRVEPGDPVMGSKILIFTYAMRVQAVVRAEEYLDVGLLRARYAEAIRAVLLGRQKLNADARVQPLSWREQYLDLVGPNTGRTLGQVWCDFEVKVSELVPGLTAYGPVETVDIEVSRLAP